MEMTGFKSIRNAFREWRKLMSEIEHPSTGVWSEHGLSPRHIKALRWTLLPLVAMFLAAIVTNGGLSMTHDWVIIKFALCLGATVGPGIVLIQVWGTRYGRETDGGHFLGWAAATVVTGLTAGHLTLWGLSSYRPNLEGKELEFYQALSQYMTFFPELFMVLLVLPVYVRFLYVAKWKRRLDFEILKRESAEHGQALAQAQLKMLQAQIEPHFLFNTLASVQHLVRKDPPRADFLLSQLIRYLREAMPDFRGMGSTLGREFGLAEAYLNIVRIRLDGRLEIKVTIPPELADISFPALIVQTLVENAIKHGIEPKPGPVHIDVTATETMVEGKQFIDVCVSDDGVGFGVAETMGTGVGLRNIRERLAGLYGSSARLAITEVQPSGVCATVRIPRTMA